MSARRDFQVKYRSACDECAASKVRCTGERPACGRCGRLSLRCVYGRSRRKGKVLSARVIVTAPAVTTPTPSAEQQDVASPHQVPADVTPGGTDTVPQRQELFSDLLHNLNGGIWNTFPPFSLTDMLPDDPISLTNGSGVQEILPEIDDPLDLTVPASQDLMDTQPTDCDQIDIHGFDEFDEQSDECATEVLSILSALYRLQNLHVSITKTSADRILPALRESTAALSNIIKRVNQIGRQQDDCLTFMLATAASKILSWYRDVYESAIRSLPPAIVQDRSEATNQLSMPGRTSSRDCRRSWIIPLSIGQMQLPPATERKMKAQMLLCELQPLAQTYTDLSHHMHSISDFRSEAHVCDMFDKHLQRGLTELQKALEAV